MSGVVVAEEVSGCETVCRDVVAALEVLRPGFNSQRRSALEALFYALGRRMSTAVVSTAASTRNRSVSIQ